MVDPRARSRLYETVTSAHNRNFFGASHSPVDEIGPISVRVDYIWLLTLTKPSDCRSLGEVASSAYSDRICRDANPSERFNERVRLATGRKHSGHSNRVTKAGVPRGECAEDGFQTPEWCGGDHMQDRKAAIVFQGASNMSLTAGFASPSSTSSASCAKVLSSLLTRLYVGRRASSNPLHG